MALVPQPSKQEEEVVEAWTFLVCLFKRKENMKLESMKFFDHFARTVRNRGGVIQLRSDKPQFWHIFDGKDNMVEPNHLNPAIFDFNCIVLAAFPSSEEVHTWWNSDEVFEWLKWREPVEKIGIFPVDGLQQGTDVKDQQRLSFGDRMMLFELLKMQKFKPIQQYVDDYKRFAETAAKDIGMNCHLLFAEGLSSVLMNEFPLDAACASSWRSKEEAHVWYDSDHYHMSLMPSKTHYAKALTIVVPIFEEKLENLQQTKAGLNVMTRLR